MNALATALAVIGYPVAIVCIARLRPMFRQHRTKWFAAHEFGTAAIVASWVIRGNGPAIIINTAWLAGVAVAWVVIGRTRNAGPSSPSRLRQRAGDDPTAGD